jgi:hypothetical protein
MSEKEEMVWPRQRSQWYEGLSLDYLGTLRLGAWAQASTRFNPMTNSA